MAIAKKSGHAVTGVLPSNSDASSVAPVTVVFPNPPANQSGGTGSTGRARVNPTGYGKKGSV